MRNRFTILQFFKTSLSQFFLIGVWLLTGDLKKKLMAFVLNKNAMLIADLFLVYVFGMFYAENMADAWHEVRIEICLIHIPIGVFVVPIP